jgi:hypothetical protein
MKFFDCSTPLHSVARPARRDCARRTVDPHCRVDSIQAVVMPRLDGKVKHSSITTQHSTKSSFRGISPHHVIQSQPKPRQRAARPSAITPNRTKHSSSATESDLGAFSHRRLAAVVAIHGCDVLEGLMCEDVGLALGQVAAQHNDIRGLRFGVWGFAVWGFGWDVYKGFMGL